jgi:hypothetical protein
MKRRYFLFIISEVAAVLAAGTNAHAYTNYGAAITLDYDGVGGGRLIDEQSLGSFSFAGTLQPGLYRLNIGASDDALVTYPTDDSADFAIALDASFNLATAPAVRPGYTYRVAQTGSSNPTIYELDPLGFEGAPVTLLRTPYTYSRGALDYSLNFSSLGGQVAGVDARITARSTASIGGVSPGNSAGISVGAQLQYGFEVLTPTAYSLSGSAGLSAVGASQDVPVLPDVSGIFMEVASGCFFDPPMAPGFDFAMTGSSLFTAIDNFPTGVDGDGAFEVWVGTTDLGTFHVGDTVNFGAGVSSFRVTGIDPLVDGGDPGAFPIQLAFNTPTASFTMTPIPEPASMAWLGTVSVALMRRRRKQGWSS